jgi:hypothetical protein
MHPIYRQGDVLIQAVDNIPKKTKKVKREHGQLILAHGEVTGHCHAIIDESAELVTAEQAAELYLLVHGTDPVALTHQEHATIMLPPGKYEVLRQLEYAPEQIRQVAD